MPLSNHYLCYSSLSVGFKSCSWFALFSSLLLLMANINFHILYYFDARGSLKYFICISEARLYIYPRALSSAISTLTTKLLICTLFQSTYFIDLRQCVSLQCLSYSRSCTFISIWFVKPYLSVVHSPASPTCRTNSILRPMWRSYSNCTFPDAFLSFSMICLI